VNQASSKKSRVKSLVKSAARRARRAVHAGATLVSNATAERPRNAAAEPRAASGPRAVATPKQTVAPAAAPKPPRRVEPISHAEALRENGFTVFRGLFPPEECARLTAQMKAEAGIQAGKHFTKVDATNNYASTRQVLFDERVLNAVRESIGADARFLQVSDLHYLHDTSAWHRDSVHRAPDASEAPDWSDLEGGDFGVVKAILYMESDNAAMGIMCGSHRSPIEMDYEFVKEVEAAGGQLIIDADNEPNQRFTEEEKRIPMAWRALPGDVLVFDERMYHAGRRVENGKVNQHREAPKFCLSMVFGADNRHSERMYSYFRYARKELGYTDVNEDLGQQLADRGLVLSNGWGNYYEQFPEDLRHAYLRDPNSLEPLIEEFSKSPKSLSTAGQSVHREASTSSLG
jgi:ectoine hydroxylase-related dioxygenase (phytanoyl-CoA dioxygenase family)